MTTPPSALVAPFTHAAIWDLVAADYASELAPKFSAFADDALALVPLADGAPVLDVATGPGTLALQAARRGLAVTAVDFSPEMIAQLDARARAAGLDARIATRVGDGHALPFDAGSFAAALSMFGLMFFADRPRGLLEMRRVVQLGGFVVIGSWAPIEQVPEIAALFAALRGAAPELGIPPAPTPLGQPREVRDALEAAELDQVRVHTVTHAIPYASAAELWASFARSAVPFAIVRQRVGEPRFAAISAAAVEALTAALGTGPLEVAMPAHLGIAVR